MPCTPLSLPNGARGILCCRTTHQPRLNRWAWHLSPNVAGNLPARQGRSG